MRTRFGGVNSAVDVPVPAVGTAGDIASETFASTVLAGASGRYADAAHRHAMLVESKAQVHITAAQLNALFAAPVTLVAAPGAGFVLFATEALFEFKAGVCGYDVAALAVAFTNDASTRVFIAGGVVNMNPGTSAVRQNAGGASGGLFQVSRANAENKPLLMIADSAVIRFGPIVTTTLAAGGLLYAIGDTGTIVDNSGQAVNDARYVVDTVGAGGAVLTYHLSAAGTDYQTGGNPKATTVLTGGGDGNFAVNVTAIAPADGDLYVTMFYTVEALH